MMNILFDSQLTMADDSQASEFDDRKLWSRSCTYELACKMLAPHKLFVLAPSHCWVCKLTRGTCSSRNAQSYADQSQC